MSHLLPSGLAQRSGNRLFVSQMMLIIWDVEASKQGAVPERQRRVAHRIAILRIVSQPRRDSSTQMPPDK